VLAYSLPQKSPNIYMKDLNRVKRDLCPFFGALGAPTSRIDEE
jgi:hypothetical protein